MDDGVLVWEHCAGSNVVERRGIPEVTASLSYTKVDSALGLEHTALYNRTLYTVHCPDLLSKGTGLVLEAVKGSRVF